MPLFRGPDQQADNDVAGVIAEHWTQVYRVCMARTSRPEDAEDATQETFIELLRTDRSLIVDYTPWLTIVAVRMSDRVLRRRYRSLEDLTENPENPVGWEALDEVLDASWFHTMTRNLPPIDRRVLTNLYLRRLSVRQAAEDIGVTAGHLRVIAHRARRRAEATIRDLNAGRDL